MGDTKKVCGNKAVLQTHDYITATQMTKGDDNVWNGNYSCKHTDHNVLIEQLKTMFQSECHGTRQILRLHTQTRSDHHSAADHHATYAE
jgi:hypothetical protein